MTHIEAIRRRRSCRSYDAAILKPAVRGELSRHMALQTRGLFGNAVRFALIDAGTMAEGELRKLSTYGVIRGARQFIVGAVAEGEMAMEDFGYCLEQVVLKATSLGLGTCILGGTFKRSAFAQQANLREGEALPAVVSVGYAADRRTVVDRMFRTFAGSDKRKPWGDLFCDGRVDTPLDESQAGRFREALECVRLAPSASNKQPWRIIRHAAAEGVFSFYLKRTPGYDKVAGASLQNIDMGIALCHLDVSTEACGITGEWSRKDPGIKGRGLEYIATWSAGHRDQETIGMDEAVS